MYVYTNAWYKSGLDEVSDSGFVLYIFFPSARTVAVCARHRALAGQSSNHDLWVAKILGESLQEEVLKVDITCR